VGSPHWKFSKINLLPSLYHLTLSSNAVVCFFFSPPLAPQLLTGFVAVNVPANGGEYVNDYTLTMDVKLDSLPKDR